MTREELNRAATNKEASDRWYAEEARKYNERQARIAGQKPRFRTDGNKFIALNEAAQDAMWVELLKRGSQNIHPGV